MTYTLRPTHQYVRLNVHSLSDVEWEVWVQRPHFFRPTQDPLASSIARCLTRAAYHYAQFPQVPSHLGSPAHFYSLYTFAGCTATWLEFTTSIYGYG